MKNITTIIIFTIFNTFFVMADGGDSHPTRDWNKSISNNKDNHLSHLISTSPNIEFERDNQFPDFETLKRNGLLERDGDLYLFLELRQDWNGSDWVNYSQYTYTYDVDGNQLSRLIQDWNGNDWVNDRQYTYTYDTDGNQLSRLDQDWNGSDWVNDYQRTYTYQPLLGTDDENNQLPSSYVLHQNYPNPFNPSTTIQYDLPKDSQVKIMIYDIMGREVRTLINNQQTSGFQSVVWDGTNDFGQEVSVGMYLYRISAGEFHQVKKMVMLK